MAYTGFVGVGVLVVSDSWLDGSFVKLGYCAADLIGFEFESC